MFANLKFMTRKCIIDSRKESNSSGHIWTWQQTFDLHHSSSSSVAFFFRCFSHGSAVASASLWRATSLGHTRALSFWSGNIGDVVHHKKWRNIQESMKTVLWYTNNVTMKRGIGMFGRFPCLISYAFLPLSSIKMLPLNVRQGAPRSECVRPPARCVQMETHFPCGLISIVHAKVFPYYDLVHQEKSHQIKIFVWNLWIHHKMQELWCRDI